MVVILRLLVVCLVVAGTAHQAKAATPNGFDPAACIANYPISGLGIQRPIGEQERAEQYVWTQLCNGRPARAQPRATISGEFLRTVLESNQFYFPGFDKIIIRGYHVTGPVALSKVRINNFVSLRDCTFDAYVDLSYVSTEHNLDLTNSEFLQGLSLRGFKSTQSVFLDPYLDTNLGEGSPDPPPTGFKFAKFVNLSLSHVAGVMAIGNLRAEYLDATGARADQFFRLYNLQLSQFLSMLNLSSGSVNVLHVVMRPGTDSCPDNPEPPARMGGIVVADSVSLDRSEFRCGLDLGSAKVGGDLSLRGALLSTLDLTGTQVDGDLVAGPAPYDRTDEHHREKLFVANRWVGSKRLILDHARIDSLRVPVNAWFALKDDETQIIAKPHATGQTAAAAQQVPVPCKENVPDNEGFWKWLREFILGHANLSGSTSSVSADGFVFRSFGAPDLCYAGEFVANNHAPIPLSLVEQFLYRIAYSPAEFDILSNLLRNHGQEHEALEVQMWKSGTERNNRFASAFPGWYPWRWHLWDLVAASFVTISGFVIGYGYHVEYACSWALIFLFLGWFLFRRLSRNGNQIGIKPKAGLDFSDVSSFWYSFETLVPIITLEEKYKDIEIGPAFTRNYFYVHRIIGYVLGIFMLGGLAGMAH